jgi:hypothetical protein
MCPYTTEKKEKKHHCMASTFDLCVQKTFLILHLKSPLHAFTTGLRCAHHKPHSTSLVLTLIVVGWRVHNYALTVMQATHQAFTH